MDPYQGDAEAMTYLELKDDKILITFMSDNNYSFDINTKKLEIINNN